MRAQVSTGVDRVLIACWLRLWIKRRSLAVAARASASSDTGSRTPVSTVRALYDNHLHYIGCHIRTTNTNNPHPPIHDATHNTKQKTTQNINPTNTQNNRQQNQNMQANKTETKRETKNNEVTWPLGQLLRCSGAQVLRCSGAQVDGCLFGRLFVWMFGCLYVWTFRRLDGCLFGCSDAWVFGQLVGNDLAKKQKWNAQFLQVNNFCL